jgi:hypothetical protein
MNLRKQLTAVAAAAALAGTAAANGGTPVNVNSLPVVQVTADITVDTTWVNTNTYDLRKQIFVTNGATLTIQPGTVIATTTAAVGDPDPLAGSGGLAVTRGSNILAVGTATQPIIFTSKNDVATWTNGNPMTGTWREAANEWGNLTIMGQAFISTCFGAFSVNPSPTNVAQMEGLVAGGPDVLYGGGNDNDDSGTLEYVSLRYGGRVIGLGNELNGLSLGGVGGDTDVRYLEIMNNVDDGIEIWGGCVSPKYFSIWNIGDDSFDLDQGWRGKAQFGLIVQGWSLDAPSGSGVCDNGIEADGAEFSNHQPRTATTMYNMTVIMQTKGGDKTVSYRDNAYLQFRNSIFMDGRQEVVFFENVADNCTGGYTAPAWLDTWNTPYNFFEAGFPGIYKAQSSGTLNEMTNCVYFNNVGAAAYTMANTVGVFAAANKNVIATTRPIRAIMRGPDTVKGGRVLNQVLKLDPRATADALALPNDRIAPVDGFFSQADYIGAFGPTENWLRCWSAADAFGFLGDQAQVTDISSPVNVPASLSATLPTLGDTVTLTVDGNPASGCGVVPGSPYLVPFSLTQIALPFAGAGCAGAPGLVQLLPPGFLTLSGTYLGAPSNVTVPIPADPVLCGVQVYVQVVFVLPLPGLPLRLGSALCLKLGTA